jgi:hypothetical protein
MAPSIPARAGRRRPRRWSLGAYFMVLVAFGLWKGLIDTLRAGRSADTSGAISEDASSWSTNNNQTSTVNAINTAIGETRLLFSSKATITNQTTRDVHEMSHSQSIPKRLQLGPIFYNLFFPSYPDDASGTEVAVVRVRGIMNEQFVQLQEIVPNSTVLITLLGWTDNTKLPFLQEEIQRKCGSKCQIRESLREGTEAHTLHAMWNYCKDKMATRKSKDAADILVTYIHDKGSFHPTESNEHARWHGTKGALECRGKMQADPSRCTACTSKFNVIPQYHANAKYVRG